MNKITAYAWADGTIEFGPKCPGGALPIVAGEEQKVRELVETQARHGYLEGVLLVPGVPEAENPDAAVDALCCFSDRVETLLQEAA